MRREEMADLTAFVAVAEESSFTRAAVKLGMSQSALSQIMRRLEARLGIRLLTRTTRSVAPTDAGLRLLETLTPALEELDASIMALAELREKPSGTIRITAVEHAAKRVLWPTLQSLLPGYPDLSVEIVVDYRLTDIVTERFDAGVRLGEQVDKDMIAVRIGPDMPMALVASPAYLRQFGIPDHPHDLVRHRCLNLRLPTSGGMRAWNFTHDGQSLTVRVEGPLIFNTIDLIMEAAIADFGIAYLTRDQLGSALASGAVTSILDEWCPPLPGYHLYYPSRRQPTAAFALLVEALRYRK